MGDHLAIHILFVGFTYVQIPLEKGMNPPLILPAMGLSVRLVSLNNYLKKKKNSYNLIMFSGFDKQEKMNRSILLSLDNFLF